jgi:uncharacterized protein (DUF2336 family)
MSLDPENLAKADPVAKVVLAKRASRFLNSSDRPEGELVTVENIARALAQDICLQVREVLAFELRFCTQLPYDLAARIATDVESVSGPFVEVTPAFTDDQWGELVPDIEGQALTRLAKRSDLGEYTAFAIASTGPKEAAAVLMKNVDIRISERVADKTVDRFEAERDIIDALGRRDDLPLSVVDRIVTMVSGECRKILMLKYALSDDDASFVMNNTQNEVLWKKIAQAGAAQVHGYVIDLKRENRLDEGLVLEMAERGSFQFLGSALALQAGVTLAEVKSVLQSEDLRRLLILVRKAKFSKEAAQRIYRVLKRNELTFGRTEGLARVH